MLTKNSFNFNLLIVLILQEQHHERTIGISFNEFQSKMYNTTEKLLNEIVVNDLFTIS